MAGYNKTASCFARADSWGSSTSIATGLSALAAIVGFGFGMDQHAEEFGKLLLEADFEFGQRWLALKARQAPAPALSEARRGEITTDGAWPAYEESEGKGASA